MHHSNLLTEYIAREPEEKGVLIKVSVTMKEDEKVKFKNETADNTLDTSCLSYIYRPLS